MIRYADRVINRVSEMYDTDGEEEGRCGKKIERKK